MTNEIELIEDILSEGDFELVSYGLAPNPIGFCYEFIGEKRDLKKEKLLNKLLENLNSEEEKYLIKRYL